MAYYVVDRKKLKVDMIVYPFIEIKRARAIPFSFSYMNKERGEFLVHIGLHRV